MQQRLKSPTRTLSLCLVTAALALLTGIAIKSAWHEWTLRRALAALSSPDAEQRESAIRLLRQNGASYAGELICLLDHGNADLRLFAIEELAETRPIPDDVVPVAIDLLENSQVSGPNRWQLIVVLGQFVLFKSGQPTHTEELAIEALRNRIADVNDVGRYTALEQLSNCVNRVPSILQTIQQYADDPDERFRLRVAMALYERGSFKESDVIDQLLGALSSPRADVRSDASTYLSYGNRFQDNQRVRDQIDLLIEQFPQYASEYERILSLLPASSVPDQSQSTIPR